jgi:hypothetical protein
MMRNINKQQKFYSLPKQYNKILRAFARNVESIPNSRHYIAGENSLKNIYSKRLLKLI